MRKLGIPFSHINALRRKQERHIMRHLFALITMLCAVYANSVQTESSSGRTAHSLSTNTVSTVTTQRHISASLDKNPEESNTTTARISLESHIPKNVTDTPGTSTETGVFSNPFENCVILDTIIADDCTTADITTFSSVKISSVALGTDEIFTERNFIETGENSVAHNDHSVGTDEMSTEGNVGKAGENSVEQKALSQNSYEIATEQNTVSVKADKVFTEQNDRSVDTDGISTHLMETHEISTQQTGQYVETHEPSTEQNDQNLQTHEISTEQDIDSTPSSPPPPPVNTPDFSQQLISAEFYNTVNQPLIKFRLSLGVIALIINALNIVVLSRKSLRSATSVYLTTLSLTEIAFVIVQLIPSVYEAFTPLKYTSNFYLTYGLFVANFLYSSLTSYTFLLTTLVCTERFFALAFPLKATVTRLISYPKTIVFVSFLLVFTCHTYSLVRHDVYLSAITDTGEELYAFRPTKFYSENKEAVDTWFMVVKVFFSYVVLGLSLISNVLLVIVLRRHQRSRQNMITSDNTNQRKRQDRMRTLTILVSSFVFTCLSLPSTIHSIAAIMIPESDYSFNSPARYSFLFFQLMGSIFFEMAFSSDFLVYVAFSATYRKTLRDLFVHALVCRKPAKTKGHSTGVHSTGIGVLET